MPHIPGHRPLGILDPEPDPEPLDPVLGIYGALTYGPYQEIKGLLGRIGRWGRENPADAAKLAGEMALDFSRVGPVKAMTYDAARDLEEGRPGWAAFNVGTGLLELALTPAALAIGGIKYIDEANDLARASDDAIENVAERVTEATTQSHKIADEATESVTLEAPNINVATGTAAGRVARAQDRLLGVFDAETPRIQGTVDDPVIVQAPSEFSGKANRIVTRLAEAPEFDAALDRDFLRSLDVYGEAGLDWYELGPILARMGEFDSPFSFQDMNILGGVLSARASVTSEIQRLAAAMYGLKRGMGIDELRRVYNPQASSGTGLLNLSGGLYDRARAAMGQGILLPADLTGPNWKTPMYYTGRLGGGAGPFSMPPLDAHELSNAAQVIRSTPRLWRDARRTAGEAQVADIANLYPQSRGPDLAGLSSGELKPGNAPGYQAIGEAYRRGMERHGLLTPQQFQAGRWIGGGYHTGLQSDPSMTFAEILADQMTRSAQHFEGATSPAQVRDYFRRVMSGDEFRVIR